ncbi:MAG: GNAT family N-acetyltransferase [Deltaproteobacteria bacterium]|nr:GNAT family N-acetyltransferase [Deltaproteobacteria bacterium]
MIKGRRVNLRRLRLSDLPCLLKWWADGELMRYYDRLPVNSPVEVEEEIRRNIGSPNRLDFMVETKRGEPVGLMYLQKIDWRNRHCELHIMVGEQARRNGLFGVEAAFLLSRYSFHQLNMHKIYGRVFEYASTVQTLTEHLGFRREAVLRNSVYQGGRYWDLYIYGLLKREFEAYLKTSKGRRGQRYLAASQPGSRD